MSGESAVMNQAAGAAATATVPGSLRFNWATLKVLWGRDLKRFFRQRSRIAGALIQPLIFWFVIGSGLSGTFRMPGAEGLGYLEYFFAGILVMVVLFSSIFNTMSVIEDRTEGFLQAVLVAPGSRAALVLGKALGGTTVALVQCALFLALSHWAGFEYGTISWAYLLTVLFATSLGLTGIGFAIAWWLQSVQGYHAIMSVLLLPAWILSGAMFPVPQNSSWLSAMMRYNPMTYCVDGIRHALYGLGNPVPGSTLTATPLLEMLLALVFATGALSLATWVCKRSE